MVKKHIILLLSAVFVLTMGLAAVAHADSWVRLGDAHVNGDVDHDNIEVGRHDGAFRAIQLRVSGGGIEFQRVVVHFENGSQEDLAVRQEIPNGGRTRAIDLPGDRRVIKSVELWYAKEHVRQHPKVTLFGTR